MAIFIKSKKSRLFDYKKELEKIIFFMEKKTKCDFSELKIYLGKNESRNMYGSSQGENHIYLNGFWCIDLKTAIKTLIHELVHVWQYKAQRLSKDADNTVFLWIGEYRQSWNDNPLLSPWEIEAADKTRILFDEYIDSSF